MTYTLRHVGLQAMLAGAILFAWLVLAIAGVVTVLSPWFLAAILVPGLYQISRRIVVLRVDAEGIRLGRGTVYEYGAARAMRTDIPWAHVRDVVVIRGEPVEVGVRLAPGAPLPEGARSMVSDPEQPDDVGPELRTAVPRSFDRPRFEAAVREHGHGVPVADLNPA